ncbi:MarR family winged helix-turn-helix transcriptional regulator [Rathayibacter sp. CAU 1779]
MNDTAVNAAAEGDLAAMWFLVRRVNTLMDRTAEALYRDGIGISLAQYLVLSVVDAYPGEINQQAVADRLSLTKGTVSRQIDAAVAAGLMNVVVSPRSRREHVVTLTPSGTDLVRKGDALLDASVRESMGGLDADDLAATVRTLDALNRLMGGAPIELPG